MDEHIAQIFEQLSVHEILNLSVGELANRFSCSRRHLNRLFHQYFGFSVAALRMEMRLLKAVALLRDPNAKIIHIADQCGFNHLGLFNSCFRRRFGASPGEWRKREPEAAKNSHTPRSEDNCRLRMIGLCPWSAEAAGAKPQLDEIEKPPRRGAKSAKAGEGPAPAPNRRLPLGRGNGDGQLRIQVRP
jgi:AraC-like DNA-binding protein